ncbi:12-oxophytodienoate reductase [Pacificispira sp.]|uniref:oxidoreductase n=1 Tax=Pacificispira sp. TaxID=2888761 RepID=UPI003B51B5CE
MNTIRKDKNSVLFQTFDYGPLRLRNRVAMAPMTRKQSPSGVPTEDVARYYERRAAGGVGLIFSEGTFIDHPSAQAHEPDAYENIPYFFGRDALKGWEAVRKKVHASGAKMMPQLWHVGEVRRLGMAPDPTVPGFGPRDIEQDGQHVVKAMDEKDMDAIARSYARGALLAREIGFDGVALHGAHGYLLDQFLWPETNLRGDGYGGDLAARMRFPCEVVARMRDYVGPDFPIVFRFSQWKMGDYQAKIVENAEALGTLLSGLTNAGVDMFDVSTRRFGDAAFETGPESLAALTRKLSGKPTIAVGSIGLDQPHQSKHYRKTASIDAKVTDLIDVTTAMRGGEFDIASVGRAVLADPDWANKVRDGRTDDIRPFVRANLETYW